MQGAGYLAIWSDLAPQDLTDWAHWITREHAAERVGVTGFLACRIFRALGASVNRYFILYELEDERVVGGPDYLARLNAPTPWSQRIMPRLGNFARGGGRIAASAGNGQGGIVAPLRLDAAPSWDAATVVAELARLDRIIAARVLLTDIAQTSIKTREKGMRANDGSFAALLLIEGLDEAAVRDTLHHLRKTLPVEDHGAIDDMPLYPSYANYALAGRNIRVTLPNALSMTGQNSSTIASVVIEPTRPFDQNTFMSPPEPIIDRRNASSARLPSTSASVNGASGMPIFLKT
jgi:hypothetical protein